MMRIGARRYAGWLAGLIATCVAVTAAADDRTDYLLQLLKTSDSFRVRSQAALSLGRSDGGDATVKALTQALGDRHPAVRTAAAAALKRLGDPSALPALEKAGDDPDAGVRKAVRRAIEELKRIAKTRPKRADGGAGQARYYVQVGKPGSNSSAIGADMLEQARVYLRERIGQIDGVVLAPESETKARAKKAMRTRELRGYFVDSSVAKVEKTDEGVRVVVSVILNTYPGRDMRAMLRGAARAHGNGTASRLGALKGAIRGALRRMPHAMASSRR